MFKFAPFQLLCASWLVAWSVSDLAAYEVLASYDRAGAQPMAPLVLAGDGNYYGTTVGGGSQDLGSVYRVTAGGEIQLLLSFTGNGGAVPGASPTAGLILGPSGVLYGTTGNGGPGNFGTVFKITTAGVFTPLVSFTGAAGAAVGSIPQTLTWHTDGNFYGTTLSGGGSLLGTVFRMTPAGSVTKLAEFTGTSGTLRGGQPQGPLVFAANAFYGAAKTGGAGGHGVVFRVTPQGVASVLADFTGSTGNQLGSAPAGGLLLRGDGFLYGTTEFGGVGGFGAAYRVSTAATPTFGHLHSFTGTAGAQPVGNLALGGDGLLYGTTAAGGSAGLGVLYKMTTGGVPTLLHSFTGTVGPSFGATPRAGLLPITAGFMGVTSAGGAGNYGVVFSLNAAGDYAQVAAFSGLRGWHPTGSPVLDAEGSRLFSLAAGGGGGEGVLARLEAAGGTANLASFTSAVGLSPSGGLTSLGGNFYGVATRGGAAGRGTVYKYSSSGGLALLGNLASGTGFAPEGPLAVLGQELFGLNREGGSLTRGAFTKTNLDGLRTRLVSFTGAAGVAPGIKPRGAVAYAAGQFYGVAESGGAAGVGTLFRISPVGNYTKLGDFTAAGPRSPRGGLVLGADGKIYGTTSLGGGEDAGTVFQIDPSTGLWIVVAEFTGTGNGATPLGPLIVGHGGAIYGQCSAGGAAGLGGVFRYSLSMGLELLESFTGASGTAPGLADVTLHAQSLTGGLTIAPDGVVYGTVPGGGIGGGGVLFRLSPATAFSQWKLATLGDAHASDLGDADQNGRVNLLEYALGSARLEPTIQLTNGTPYLSFVLPRNPARGDLIYTVEASDHLASGWVALASSVSGLPYAGPGYVGGDAATPGLKQVEFRDTVATSPQHRRFLRVRVSH